MRRARILKDMDKLVHDKHEGFYDAELDMWFECLTRWLLVKHNVTWADVL